MEEKRIKIYLDEYGNIIEVIGIPEGYEYIIVDDEEKEKEE